MCNAAVRRKGRVWMLCVSCTLLCTAADLRPTGWSERAEQAAALQQQQRYGAAEKLLLTMLKEAGSLSLPDPDVALLLNNLGGLYLEQGRHAEAEHDLRRSLALLNYEVKAHRTTWLGAASNLVAVYTEMQEFGRAEKLGKLLFSRSETELLPYPMHRAHVIHNLAGVYHSRGDLRQAERLLRKAVSILEESDSQESSEMMSVLISMGTTLTRTRQAAEALICLERARQIAQKMVDPRSDIDRARAFIIESAAYRSIGQVSEAGVVIQNAIAILLKEDNCKPVLQIAWNEHAEVLRHSGRKAEARKAAARAKAIHEELQRDDPARHTVNINTLMSLQEAVR